MAKTPIRCFDGNAKPHEPFWLVRNAAETGSDAEIELYGVLSEYSWLEDDITPALFREELNKLGGAPVTLRINSPGGDVIAASLMRAMLTDYPGHVTARVDGICASAATVVALAADKITMQDSAFMMIHDPSVVFLMAELNIETMSSMLDALKTVKGSILDAYETRTGMSRDRLAKMMRDETWMSASDAQKFGFADDVISGGKTASAKAFANTLRNYVHVPAQLLNCETQPVDSNVEQARRLRDEVQILK